MFGFVWILKNNNDSRQIVMTNFVSGTINSNQIERKILSFLIVKNNENSKKRKNKNFNENIIRVSRDRFSTILIAWSKVVRGYYNDNIK
jgi:RNase P/RNase MRP subunit POP5